MRLIFHAASRQIKPVVRSTVFLKLAKINETDRLPAGTPTTTTLVLTVDFQTLTLIPAV